MKRIHNLLERNHNLVIVPVDYQRAHDLNGEDCWCIPDIEKNSNGSIIVIHHSPNEKAEKPRFKPQGH